MATPSELDANVGLPIEGAGKKVATKELTRDDGSVVERQEIVAADASDVAATQTVKGERGRGKALTRDLELAEEIRMLRVVLEDIRALLMKL